MSRLVGTVEYITFDCWKCEETVTVKGYELVCPNCGAESILEVIPKGASVMTPLGAFSETR